MADYIKRKKLYDTVLSFTGMFNDEGFWISSQAVLNAIAFTEAADVVEVVRCKDCDNMYFHKQDNGLITMRCCFHEIGVKENDFCNYGERQAE